MKIRTIQNSFLCKALFERKDMNLHTVQKVSKLLPFYNQFNSLISDRFKILSCLSLVFSEYDGKFSDLDAALISSIQRYNRSSPCAELTLCDFTQKFLADILECLSPCMDPNHIRMSKQLKRAIIFLQQI